MKNTSRSVAGKTALITGSARRIGATLAHTLHHAGMNIVLHHHSSASEASKLCDQLNRLRADSAVKVSANLLHANSLQPLVTQAQQFWDRLDVLINNASSFYPTTIGTITEQHWDELMGTNLKAPLFLSQAAAPYLKKNHGCIINIVDIHAERPLKNYPLYCAAKAGLVMLTKATARELAPDIRTNGIAPGAILWPEMENYNLTHQQIIQRTALRRQGSPEDIARTALFLIRDADYITGQIIIVDGGRTLSN